jgi:uncharacterized membrane protein
MATPLFTTPPVVMFVGASADLADECARANPVVPVIRVGHAAAAVERMLVTRPLVVILDESVSEKDKLRVLECANDIRAQVVSASAALASELAVAVRTAMLAAERVRG